MTNTNTAAASGTAKHYAERDHEAQGVHYINHVSAMTGEGLHAKSAIAAELAHRDMEIDRLRAALAAAPQPAAQALDKDEAKAQRLTEKRWLEVGKAVERAFIDLPEWVEVVLYLANGSGSVKWIDSDGDERGFDTHGDCFSEVINSAINDAIAAQQGGAA